MKQDTLYKLSNAINKLRKVEQNIIKEKSLLNAKMLQLSAYLLLLVLVFTFANRIVNSELLMGEIMPFITIIAIGWSK